jgi:alpha-beta hydrolase superfamily lysophospholipase
MDSIFDSEVFNQNLFFPRVDYSNPPGNAEELYIEVETDIKVHVRKFPAPSARFSLIYFHGNGEIVSDYNDLAQVFGAIGGELVACDYRGYGKSNGNPSLRTVLNDACAIYECLAKNQVTRPLVCVMGRSLGSASAIELGAKYPEIDGCVIESGYADPIPLVERRGLKVDSITPEENAVFNNSEKIKKITAPLLIMHGKDDKIISYEEAELNFANAGSKVKELELIDSVGHNDIMLASENKYFGTLEKFFSKMFYR